MATTYKKNAQNVYKVPLYAQFWVVGAGPRISGLIFGAGSVREV